MQKRLLKKWENSVGSGYGHREDRKSQRKRFRRVLAQKMIQEGLEEIEEENSPIRP